MSHHTNKKPNQNISLLLLFKNNEAIIQKNLTWLKDCPIINEIIGVDNNSEDNSQNSLRQLKSPNLSIKIYKRNLGNDFSTQRQFGINKAKNNWIFWLDTDEKPSQNLIDFLNDFYFPNHQAFSFKRHDIFLEQTLKHGETQKNNFIRLFNKNEGAFIGKVHEKWQTNNCVINTELYLFHHPHPNLTSLLTKINFYTDIRAHELNQLGQTTSIGQIILYPIAKFIKNYFLLLGFLDGTVGMIFALSMSLHSFLSKAKLWHLQHS